MESLCVVNCKTRVQVADGTLASCGACMRQFVRQMTAFCLCTASPLLCPPPQVNVITNASLFTFCVFPLLLSFTNSELEYSSENIEFWLAVQRFEQLYSLVHKPGPAGEETDLTVLREMRQGAEDIIAMFITSNAECGVNLPSEQKHQVENDVHHGQITRNMFSEAGRTIFTLMETDSYTRFKKTRLYEDLCVDMGFIMPYSPFQPGKIESNEAFVPSEVTRGRAVSAPPPQL